MSPSLPPLRSIVPILCPPLISGNPISLSSRCCRSSVISGCWILGIPIISVLRRCRISPVPLLPTIVSIPCLLLPSFPGFLSIIRIGRSTICSGGLAISLFYPIVLVGVWYVVPWTYVVDPLLYPFSLLLNEDSQSLLDHPAFPCQLLDYAFSLHILEGLRLF